MKPSSKTIKKLFAVSQNQCAFKDCDAPIVEDSDSVTGVICHIKARSGGGPRFDAKQTDEERHSFANLILLCARHSKIIDSEPERYTVNKLQEMKRLHEVRGPVELRQTDARKADLLFRHYDPISIAAGGHVMLNSPGSVQASNVVIKNAKKTIKIAPPAGSVASDLSRRNYVKHLIDRYQEFAKQQSGRPFRHPVIYDSIKRHFGAKWDNVPLLLFEDLVSFLQQKVDGTMRGRMNRSKGIPNYSTFADYLRKYEHQEVANS